MRQHGAIAIVIAATIGSIGCSASNEGGCTKDRDCKGNRVCLKRECVDAQPQAPSPQVQAPTPQPEPDPEPNSEEHRRGRSSSPPVAPAPSLHGTCNSAQEIAAHPGQCVLASDPEIDRSGVIKSYRELKRITLLNKSALPVRNVQGHVMWIDDGGRVAGGVPFSVQGIIPAGGVLTVSKGSGLTSSGKLETRANRAQVVVDQVEPIP